MDTLCLQHILQGGDGGLKVGTCVGCTSMAAADIPLPLPALPHLELRYLCIERRLGCRQLLCLPSPSPRRPSP